MLRIVGVLTIAWVLCLPGCSPQAAKPDRGEVDSEGSSARDAPAGPAESLAAPAAKTRPDPEEPAEAGSGQPQQTTAVPGAEPQSETKSPAAAEDLLAQTAIMQLLEQMASEDMVERRAASDTLDECGGDAVATIIQGLQKGSLPQRRGAATYLIGRVSPRDATAVPALIEALASNDEVLRRAALQAVEKTAEGQLVAALPALIAYAENAAEAEAYRSRAIRAIAKLGPRGRPATPQLIQLADRDASLNVRRACLSAIVKVATPEEAERFYQTRLRESELAEVRRLAAKWLPSVVSSETSLTCLVQALSDKDQSVRLEAVNALVAVGKPALPRLIAALESPNVETRRHGVLAIGKFGLLATDAAAPLRKCLDDPDPQVRELATAALSVLRQ